MKRITSSKIILVGPHGTVDPEWAKNVTRADFVFRGEVDALTVNDIRKICAGERSGCGFFPGGEAIRDEIGELGRCCYEPADLEGSVAHCWRPEAEMELRAYLNSSALIESSRGCSFDCQFCLRAGFRRKLRLKDLSIFEQEISDLSEWGAKYCFLIDETFGNIWEHSEKVCQVLADYGIRFGAQTRPDLISGPKLRTLAQAGCIYLELGTETLTDENLKALGKFRSAKKVRAGSKESQSRIKYVGENILDVSNPDLGLVEKKQFWSQKDNEGALAPAFIPYPATPMGESVLNNGSSSLPPWEHAKARFQMYSLVNRYPLFRKILKTSRVLREVTVRLIPFAEKNIGGLRGLLEKSRFEMRRSRETPKPSLGDQGSV
ncbi:MAG: radical SAM protein [Candidatus Thiodiazotropha endolucinida]